MKGELGIFTGLQSDVLFLPIDGSREATTTCQRMTATPENGRESEFSQCDTGYRTIIGDTAAVSPFLNKNGESSTSEC